MTAGSGGYFRNISVLLSGTDTLTPTLARAGTSVDTFSKKLAAGSGLSGASKSAAKDTESLGSSVLGTAKAMSTGLLGTALFTGGVVALSLGLRDVIDGAVEFNRAMQNVQSISFLTDAQIKAMSGSVLDLSKKLPVSAADLANALYPIASHGYTGAAALEVLDASAKAAAAGLSDTVTAATIIGSVLNAYGQSADQATAASDALLTTVQHGVLTFDTLASTLSQTIGIASTAGVSINEVGAAIDTMTRAGVTGDQAGTELNRVIQQLLKPTADMKEVLQQMGFESGYAALQTLGLHGVLTKLGSVTGDNVNTMLALFTDVRAARGAMALMTDQGKLYNDEFQAVGTATAAAGATQASLVEQSKSASFQLKIFGNDVRAAAITAGSDALPYLVSFVHELENLGVTISHDMVPIIDDLGQSLKNLAPVAHTASDALGQIGGLAGGAGLVTLRALGTAVVDLTGFLGKNEEIVIGLAAAYSTKLGASLLETLFLKGLYAKDAIFAAEKTVQEAATVAIATVRYKGLAVAAKDAGASMAASMSVASLGAAALVALIGTAAGGMAALANDNKKAVAALSPITDTFDPTDFAGSQQKLDQLRATAVEAASHAREASGLLNQLHAGEQLVNPFEANSIDATASKGKAAADAYNTLSTQLANVRANAQAAASQVGLVLFGGLYPAGSKGNSTIQQFATLAKASGIDLSKPVDQSSAAVRNLVATYQTAAQTVPGLAHQMAASGTVDIQALTDAAQATQAAITAAQSSFTSATDIISNYTPTGTPKEVAAAQKALQTAQDQQQAAQTASDQLDARIKASMTTRTITSARTATSVHQAQTKAHVETLAQQQSQTNAASKLADAVDKVKTAQQNLADAQAAAANPDQQYAAQLQAQQDLATKFVNGINTATQRGLNITAVQQLLEAGPKAAEPILDAIAADHSGKLIALINQTQTTLAKLNAITVEDARLTAEAIASTTDQLAKDLPAALKIADLEFQGNGQANAADIAKMLGISPSDATRIATEFGITLNQHLATITPTFGQLQSVVNSQIPKGGRATYMTPPTVAQLQGVITSQVPRQSAGSVGPMTMVTNNNTYVNVGPVETNDGGLLVDQMKAKARVANLTPGLPHGAQ